MAKGSFGDIIKGVFYLILILILVMLIAKFWGLRKFFSDVALFTKEIFRGI